MAPRGERVYANEFERKAHQYEYPGVPVRPRDERDVKLVASDLHWRLRKELSGIYQDKVAREFNVEFGTCLRGGPLRDSVGRCIDRPCGACWPLPEGWDG